MVPPTLSVLIAQTANMISAQRLVRKICQHCITPYALTKETNAELEAQFDMKAILETIKREGVGRAGTAKNAGMQFFKGAGCAQCGGEGYRGRLAIHELLEVTPEISALIYTRAPTDALQKAARAGGMITLVEDAFIKAAQGLTTIDEIVRVTKE